MERKEIELGGIVRNLPDNTVKDGMFQELINLRPKDGALRPVGMKDCIDIAPRSVRWIHRINDSIKVYVGFSEFVDVTYLSYWVLTNGVCDAGHTTTIPNSSETKFASLKNSLLVSDITNEKSYLLVFNVDATPPVYESFEEQFLPEDMPCVLIRSVVDSDASPSSEVFEVSAESNYGEAELSQYVKMQKSKGDDGYLSGKVIVRFAWELFDGTIVKHTLPIALSTSEIATEAEFGATYLGGTSPGWRITTNFTTYQLQFDMSTLTTPALLSEFKAKWENIIKSLKIYVSLPKSPELQIIGERAKPYAVREKNFWGTYTSVQVLIYDVSELQYYSPDPSEELYYLLKEYKLSELTQAGSWTSIVNETINDLGTREQMPTDNFSHHQLFANSLFAYNERIFLGDIKNYLSHGFPVDDVIFNSGSTTGEDYEAGIEFDILTGEGMRSVFSGWKTLNTYDIPALGHARIQLGYTNDYYIGYPDARATKMRLLLRFGSIIYRVFEAGMEVSQLNNFAFVQGRTVQLPTAITNLPQTQLSTKSDFYYDHDRIQATELNNPFFYPVINSYRAQGKVLGLSTNAIALSSGQFGQFPIYAFTNEGIWTMGIGTGETLINTITPLSREVCNNPASITPIDGGTAFTSGRGLFIISGNQVIEISDTAEGKETSRLTGLAAYNTMLSQPNLSGTAYSHCSVPFLSYLQGAVIGFDYVNSELIVSNYPVNPNYSWVYSLKSKIWFKISQAWNTFVTDYPKLYAYNNGLTSRRHDMNIEDFRSVVDDLALVFGQTRPIKISGADFKKIHRVNLGGNIQNDITPAMRFVVAVFGTTDNKTWFLLNNGRDFGTDDVMVLGRSQHSIRQIIVVFGGHVEADSYLNYLTFDFEERYGGKLR